MIKEITKGFLKKYGYKFDLTNEWFGSWYFTK